MSYFWAFLISFSLLLFPFSPVEALPQGSKDRAELFATCSGRMEALAARHRGRKEDDAILVTDMQQEFDLMLQAVLPWALSDGVDEIQPARWRVQGWVQVAYLLADIDYSLDAQITEGAKRQLHHRIAECRAVLL
ncbi:hypothetical protein RA28_20715 [Ruegeria sp. ANG-S4]|nr:hypothetical protein RA28_20715 [Ruegeria sp. ANG-S4]